MYSGGKGLNGAVNSTACIAALSAAGKPDDLYTLCEINLPSLAILNNRTTRLLSLPLGGSQFILIRRCNSRIYGPKSGSLTASMPGAPLGLPGPGLPTLPLLPVLPGENLPPVELPELLGEKLGDGVYLLPLPELPLFEPEPDFVPATGPPDGPATFGAAIFGAGMLNVPLGFCVLGALGLIAGFGAGACALGTPCGAAGFSIFLGAHGGVGALVVCFGVGAVFFCCLGCCLG